MTTVLLTFIVFVLAMVGLGLGVLFGRAPVKGSCGGLACLKKKNLGCSGGCTGEPHD